jgi:hypothetical protein
MEKYINIEEKGVADFVDKAHIESVIYIAYIFYFI